ncbi:hypothetical protein Ddc_07804 [Ditylenchus destructor]|nr:hypothetical protein Ddc_07804 [Ditylenchus destructor]
MTEVKHEIEGEETESAAEKNGNSANDLSIKKEAIENGEKSGTHKKFDESYMPVPGLQLVSEEEGYRYYADLNTTPHKQYCLEESGFWYVWNDIDGVFVPVTDTAQVSDAHSEKVAPNGISYNEQGLPVFPTNAKGQPVLPKDENDQPFFPVDQHGNPVFPYDFTKRQWTFPVDDAEEPVFPRNPYNKPIVPQDENGKSIFPVDQKGTFIFPLDEKNCPMPAVTVEGKAVVPLDEYGNFVIPRDREGKALIHIASDGVTPMSIQEYKEWKQYCKTLHVGQSQRYYQTHTSTGTMYPTHSMFHPLNIDSNGPHSFARDVEMLQRGKRVRPEDIDLPTIPTSSSELGEPQNTAAYYNSQNNRLLADSVANAPQANDENEKALKRKKFLSAQLNFSKKLSTVAKKPQTEDIRNNKQSAEKEERPLSNEELIAAVRKSMNSKKDFAKEPPQMPAPVARDEERNVPKRKHTSEPSSESSPENRWREVESRSSSRKEEKVSRRRRSSSMDTSSSEDMNEKREQISRQVISAIFGTEEPEKVDLSLQEYGPAVPQDLRKNEHEKSMRSAEQSPEQYSHKSKSKSSRKESRKDAPMYDLDDLKESGDLDTLKRCIRQTRKRYEAIKKQISALEKEKSTHKKDLVRLVELERRLEDQQNMEDEYLSSSDS